MVSKRIFKNYNFLSFISNRITDRSLYEIIVTILIIIIAALFSILIALIIIYRQKTKISEAKKLKKLIITKANEQKRKILDEANEYKTQTENEVNKIREELTEEKKTITTDRIKLDREIEEVEILKKSLENNEQKIKTILDEAISNIEKVENYSRDEAKEALNRYILKLNEDEFLTKLNELKNTSLIELKYRAQDMLIFAMESVKIQATESYNVSYISLESEEKKGRVIGKEGRNLKAFQQFCGVDVIISEGLKIQVSSLNPIRREIAVRVINKLLATGRMQPAFIEEEEKNQRAILEDEFYEIGYETIKQLHLDHVSDTLIYLLGRLKYRSSYSQNVLAHSIEVAQICGTLASELGLDPTLATRCGLFHDIGKAVEYDTGQSHVDAGVAKLKQANESLIVINAVEAHHDDVEKESVYAELVVIADALSAARPGARNNDIANYVQRINSIEEECNKIKGVLKTYALQSGRRIHVIVDPLAVSDIEIDMVGEKIREAITRVNKVGGNITVTIIREKRKVLNI